MSLRDTEELKEVIAIHGAREHNLKNISLTIPRNKFVVVTGVSGSGKSTLAFDLLFAEGQRRFLDSMNVYARQFVEQMSRPDVDLITGIPPTVSIEQRNSRGGGKSTVATVTEIYHFFRLLYSKLGTQFCPKCDLPVQPQTTDAIVTGLLKQLAKSKTLHLLAPVVRNRKGFHSEVAQWALKNGYPQIRADGALLNSKDSLRLDRFKEHDVEIVLASLDKTTTRDSLLSVVTAGLKIGSGAVYTLDTKGSLSIFSTQNACPKCQTSFPVLDPKLFSYNSSQGWCPECRGFGELFYLPDVDRGANADSIEESWFNWQEGKRELCPQCLGARLRPETRAVRLFCSKHLTVGQSEDWCGVGPTIVELCALSIDDVAQFFQKLDFEGRSAEVARDMLPEINTRLHFLQEVGLGYMQLGRGATTLSGGEAQRIRLAAQLGSNLSGVLYVLDEPTIGLHARDNDQLLNALQLLKNRGNSLIVVEHDEETMRRSDWIIDLGPGAGVLGGTVIAEGTHRQISANPDSTTGRLLHSIKKYPTRGTRRPVDVKRRGKNQSPFLMLRGADIHNLKNVTASIPLNRFVSVTGVSGSGKSTLIRECLLPLLQSHLKKEKANFGKMELAGFESLVHVHEVDQSPIGRTSRSTPATYVGFFDDVRNVFAQTPDAKMRGYTSSRFSFNSAQGRCPDCEGAGTIKMEMNFLPPAYVLCESCQGKRFNPETLQITYKDKNIAEVLDLSVAEALQFFAVHTKIARPLQALVDTGLHYLKIGQRSPTLSGGEAQRLKLVTHLLTGLRPAEFSRKKFAPAIFILEEPTIGLHMADVQKLVEVIQRLVDAGHSVVVIEHNLDLVAESDWVIDLGPEGGQGGGEIVIVGTPEEVCQEPASHTGRYLLKQMTNV
ncbi:MAG: excinuclease subunit [Verrucomicrobiales bacterium]|nr:excinuclease subunit [Verrucomicrobiales bacterium]